MGNACITAKSREGKKNAELKNKVNEMKCVAETALLNVESIAQTLSSIRTDKYFVRIDYLAQKKKFMKDQKILPHEFHLMPAPILLKLNCSTIMQRRQKYRSLVKENANS